MPYLQTTTRTSFKEQSKVYNVVLSFLDCIYKRTYFDDGIRLTVVMLYLNKTRKDHLQDLIKMMY